MTAAKITVVAKMSGGAEASVDIEPDMTIMQVKEALSGPLKVAAAENRLIYKGRITKNDDIVKNVGIVDGSVVHVLKTPAATAKISSAAPAAVTAIPNTTAQTTEPAPAGTAPSQRASGATSPPDMNELMRMMQERFGGMGGSNDMAGLLNSMGGAPGMGGADLPPMNPALLSQMLQNPVMNQMITEMSQNPQMLTELIRNNPMLQGFQNNPMFRNFLNNPEQLSAAFQAQARMFGGANNMGGGAAGGSPPVDPFAAMMGGGSPNMQSLETMMQSPEMQRLVQSLGMGAGGPGAMGGSGNANDPPAVRFATQLSQLEDMGFIDKDANLQVIQETNGDVDAAITRLLERGIGN